MAKSSKTALCASKKVLCVHKDGQMILTTSRAALQQKKAAEHSIEKEKKKNEKKLPCSGKKKEKKDRESRKTDVAGFSELCQQVEEDGRTEMRVTRKSSASSEHDVQRDTLALIREPQC